MCTVYKGTYKHLCTYELFISECKLGVFNSEYVMIDYLFFLKTESSTQTQYGISLVRVTFARSLTVAFVKQFIPQDGKNLLSKIILMMIKFKAGEVQQMLSGRNSFIYYDFILLTCKCQAAFTNRAKRKLKNVTHEQVKFIVLKNVPFRSTQTHLLQLLHVRDIDKYDSLDSRKPIMFKPCYTSDCSTILT